MNCFLTGLNPLEKNGNAENWYGLRHGVADENGISDPLEVLTMHAETIG